MNSETSQNKVQSNGKTAARRLPVDNTPKLPGRMVAAIMISVMLGILLAALDQTVVGPAMPKIIADLNGFDHYTWVFTIYLLTSTISVPIFGKLSDMYGRKWFYVAGIVVFLIGSMLSGLSGDIFQLIAYRGLQGLGAGIITANAFAIIADVIPPADRGKWQGAFGGIFGLASVVGPTIGGYLTDTLNWRWVFYVNLPIGIIALAVLVALFPATNQHGAKKSIDWWGAGTLVAGLTPLLLALSLGGTPGWDWGSTQVIGLLAVAVLFLGAFIFVETRAKEPILPLDLFKNRIFTVSVITVFVTGVGLFGAVLYIPLFVQAIQGDSATSSGNAITPMTIAIVVSSIVTGQIISRTGKYRVIGVLGMGFVTLGMFLLYTMNMDTERLVTISYMVVMGLGLGVAFPLYTLAVQNAFPIQRVGVVTAAVQFFRNMGSTVGTAVLGTIVNNQFHDRFGPEFATRYNALTAGIPGNLPPGGLPAGTPGGPGGLPSADQFLAALGNLNPQVLVGQEALAKLQANLVLHGTPEAFAPKLVEVITDALRPALFTGIQEAFLIATVLLGIGMVTTIFLKEIPLRKTNEGGALAAMAKGSGESAAVEAGREMAASGLPGSNLPARDEPVLTRK